MTRSTKCKHTNILGSTAASGSTNRFSPLKIELSDEEYGLSSDSDDLLSFNESEQEVVIPHNDISAQCRSYRTWESGKEPVRFVL